MYNSVNLASCLSVAVNNDAVNQLFPQTFPIPTFFISIHAFSTSYFSTSYFFSSRLPPISSSPSFALLHSSFFLFFLSNIFLPKFYRFIFHVHFFITLLLDISPVIFGPFLLLFFLVILYHSKILFPPGFPLCIYYYVSYLRL